MIYLGWDPGLRFLGWGVLDLGPSSSRALGHGVLGEASDRPWNDRLDELAGGIDEIMNRFLPDVVAYEDQAGVEVAMQRDGEGTNYSSRRLHEVCGMIRFAARAALSEPVPCYCAQPRSVKVALLGSGHGSAEKSQVQRAVRMLFGVQTNQHACDALAVAVCGSRMHRRAVLGQRRSAALIR